MNDLQYTENEAREVLKERKGFISFEYRGIEGKKHVAYPKTVKEARKMMKGLDCTSRLWLVTKNNANPVCFNYPQHDENLLIVDEPSVAYKA